MKGDKFEKVSWEKEIFFQHMDTSKYISGGTQSITCRLRMEIGILYNQKVGILNYNYLLSGCESLMEQR